jgi:uncharacterized Zn ribbon protein
MTHREKALVVEPSVELLPLEGRNIEFELLAQAAEVVEQFVGVGGFQLFECLDASLLQYRHPTLVNTMGGEVVVTHAFCKDNEIFLKDFTKNTLLFTGDSLTLKNDLRVHATGQMYEDNTLILNMIYEGEAETNERTFEIYGDNIRMAAIRN